MKIWWLTIALGICTLLSGAYSAEDGYMVVAARYPRSPLPSDDTTTNEPAVPIKITEMRVRSEIALRYVRTSVITHVQNPSSRPQDVTFRMLLPETAFISGFTMILDGKSYKAYVKEKEEAKQIYSEAVSQGIGAAHIATKARDSNHFTVTVNVEGNTTGIFDLRYEEFLIRRNGVYNHAVNLHPGGFVPKMEVIVHIKESQKITKLRVPEVRTGNEIDATEKDAQNSKAVIRRATNEREATVTFTPDLVEQKRLAEIYVEKTKEKSSSERYIGYSSDEEENDQDTTVLGQFVVQYDVERSNNGEVLVNDGYFVHFLAPSSLPPLSKHAVFVLDTSGSMMGRKIEQLRNAMEAILSDLHSNDYFSIVEFNSDVKVHELKEADQEPPPRYMYYSHFDSHSTPATLVPPSPATPENIAKAKVIVSRLYASGGTNIYNALSVALNLITKGVRQGQSLTESTTENVKGDVGDTKVETEVKGKELEPIIIFLTDGDPTVGETSTARIISFVTEKNSGDKRASLYSLAFGEDADRTFLRKLSLRNEGFMRHIYEASDASLQLHDFYRQVSSPLLAHVQFLYPRQQIKEGTVSRSQFRTINAGSEVAVVGQIGEDVTEITPQVLAFCGEEDGVGRKRFEISSKVAVKRDKNEYLPLERLWAYLTIKQLLDKRDSTDDHKTDEESPEKKALAIALKYEFVTPLTSLVVVKPNETNAVDVESVDKQTSDVFLPYMASGVPSNAYLSAGIAGPPSPSFWPSANIRPLALDAAHSYEEAALDETESDDIYDLSNPMRTVALFSSRRRLHPMGVQGPPSYGAQGRPGYDDVPMYSFFEKASSSEDQIPQMYSPKGDFNLPSYPGPPGPGGFSYGFAGLPGPLGPSNDYITSTRRPPGTSSYLTTDLPSEKPNSSAFTGRYNLEDFEWAVPLINADTDSLEFVQNETQISLLLTLKNIDPPKADGGDSQCRDSVSLFSESVVGLNEKTGSVCVYLTRCSVARNITADDYKKSYCFVNNSYAGVCCPRSEVDKKP